MTVLRRLARRVKPVTGGGGGGGSGTGVQLRVVAGSASADTALMPVSSDTALAVRFETGLAGVSGAQLSDNGVPLKPGQLLPANIGQVSVWANGVEVPAYVETISEYPDGSARSLYVQTLLTYTANTPIAGEIRMTGGFTQARRTFVDNSSTKFTNTASPFTAGGLPAALCVPLSTRHLCAALPSFLPLVPEAFQPVFTNSTAVDAAFVASTETSQFQKTAWPVFGADYDSTIGCLHKWARTGDTRYFKLWISDWCKAREWNISIGWQPGEPRQYYESAACAVLLLRDFAARAGIYATVNSGANYAMMWANYTSSPYWRVATSTPEEYVANARDWSKLLGVMAFVNIAFPPSTVTNGVTHATWGERWLERATTSALFTGGWFRNFDYSTGNFGATFFGSYQQGLMFRSIIALTNQLPASTIKTTALNAVSAMALFLRQNALETSEAGTVQFTYFTGPPAYGPDVTTPNAVDLNGFFATLYAWRAWRENSVTDANLARDLYATIAFTPQDGTTGPFIGRANNQKQQQEAFFMSQSVHYYLALAGL